jgi:A/G-specific adenine glycosylase
MQKAAILVLERHGGRFPETFDAILALPGIGRYTAGAICSIAFNQPTPILDGNVIRVLTRVFGIEKNPRERKTNAFLWHTAEELVAHASRITHQATRTRTRTRTKGATEPILGCSHLNQSLMELGALICTPRSPRCHLCPVKQLCVAFRQNRVEQLPSLGPRAAITERRFVAFIIERNGKFLVHQRPAGIVNAHLWEFPNAEVAAAVVRSSAFRRLLATRRANRLKAELRTFAPLRLPKNPRPFCTIKHSITRYRITLDAFYVQLGKSKSVKTKRPWRRGTPPAEFDGVWLKLPDLKKLSFPSAHKQIIAALADPG